MQNEKRRMNIHLLEPRDSKATHHAVKNVVILLKRFTCLAASPMETFNFIRYCAGITISRDIPESAVFRGVFWF